MTVTMTMNQGLFDIQVDVGTDDANGIVHTGTTTGPASSAADDHQRIYMVAVPKNQALTMLLSGDIGFEASAAEFENGEVILSSGHSINNLSATHVVTGAPGANSEITIGGDAGAAHFTSNVWGVASGEISALASSAGLNFDGNVEFVNQNAPVDGDILLGASNGFSLFVNGTVRAFSTGSATPFGGTVQISATSGGIVDMDQAVQLISGVAAGSSAAGTVSLYADNGDIDIGGTLDLNAGVGAADPNPDVQSSDNKGGTATIYALNGGDIVVQNANINVSANGQDNAGNGDGSAGDGTGGLVDIYADGGGSLTVNGNLSVNADGYGGNMRDGGTLGGKGQGGEVYLTAADGTIHVTGNLFGDRVRNRRRLSRFGHARRRHRRRRYRRHDLPLYSRRAGFPFDRRQCHFRPTAPAATGRPAAPARAEAPAPAASTARSSSATSLTPFTSARPEPAATPMPASAAPAARARAASPISRLGPSPGTSRFQTSFSTITGGNATLDVSGQGGSGGAGNGDNVAAGAGGTGQGGLFSGQNTGGAFAAAMEENASLTLGNVSLNANGAGGAGGSGAGTQSGGAGGLGKGGTAQAGNYDPDATGALTATATYGTLSLDANGTGGAGGAHGIDGGIDGNGGDAFGGNAVLNAKGRGLRQQHEHPGTGLRRQRRHWWHWLGRQHDHRGLYRKHAHHRRQSRGCRQRPRRRWQRRQRRRRPWRQ